MLARPPRTAAMIQTLRSLMLPLPAMPGFLSSRLYVEADNPNAICYVEEWQTAEELDVEIRSAHYTRLLSVMEEAAEPPILRLHWIAAEKGLEYLEAVRRIDHCGNDSRVHKRRQRPRRGGDAKKQS